MSSVSLDHLDEHTLGRLRERALRHGVSMEEEVCRIVQSALSPPERIGDMASAMFGPEHGVELELPRHWDHEPPRFER